MSKLLKTKRKTTKRTPRSPEAADLELGKRIHAARKESAMSQTTLAKMVGVTFQQIQKYEKGYSRVSVSRLSRIAAALKRKPTDLLPAQPAPPVASLINVKDANAIRLVRAYSRIESDEVRHQMVELAEALAAEA